MVTVDIVTVTIETVTMEIVAVEAICIVRLILHVFDISDNSLVDHLIT